MTNKTLCKTVVDSQTNIVFLTFPSAYNRTEEKCSSHDLHCWNPVWSVADSCA